MEGMYSLDFFFWQKKARFVCTTDECVTTGLLVRRELDILMPQVSGFNQQDAACSAKMGLRP